MASFDTCPAAKTEWVFDLHGEIYGCTASCGRKEYKLGDFWPEVKLNEEEINKWKKRDVVNIKECNDCAYDVICGAGCGVMAGNKNNLDILKPDCRPIQSILDIGIKHYKDEIENLSDEIQDEDLNHEEKGCVICGEDLIYKNNSTKEKCEICGFTYDSNAVCKQGHFICDACHVGGILEKVKEILVESKEKSPVTLANIIFNIPNLKLHGPEYHSIVPAVVVAAWANNNPDKDNKVEYILEAIRRGKNIKGGSCGFNGACGSGIGIGIAKSIIDDVTPYSKEERGKANYLTAKALMEISKYSGPRCCKRDAICAIEALIEETDYFHGIKNGEYKCKQFKLNKECIGNKCNYFPKKSKVL
jgi:radical SAM protein with 4Fe4S-binding SPASM domain